MTNKEKLQIAINGLSETLDTHWSFVMEAKNALEKYENQLSDISDKTLSTEIKSIMDMNYTLLKCQKDIVNGGK